MLIRTLTSVLWLLAALLIGALCLRIGMRLAGVRDDMTFPGLIYVLTAPFAAPFYTLFPASPRFEESVVELASLVAAGSVLAAVAAIYAAGLLLFARRKQTARPG